MLALATIILSGSISSALTFNTTPILFNLGYASSDDSDSSKNNDDESSTDTNKEDNGNTDQKQEESASRLPCNAGGSQTTKGHS